MKKSLVLRLDGRFSGHYAALGSAPTRPSSATPPERSTVTPSPVRAARPERRPLSENVPALITPLDTPEYFRL